MDTTEKALLALEKLFNDLSKRKMRNIIDKLDGINNEKINTKKLSPMWLFL